MPPDEPAPGPYDEPPLELDDSDLRSAPQRVAAPSAPSAPTPPRPSASPQPHGAPATTVRAPRAATLFGIGNAARGPAVDETQRLLAQPPTLQETQRRMTGGMATAEPSFGAPASPPPPEIAPARESAPSGLQPPAAEVPASVAPVVALHAPSDRVRLADPDAETLDGAPAVEMGLPAIELPAPAEVDTTVSHPPVAPPKPRDADPEPAGPKVVVEGRRAIPDELAETQISARRVQLPVEESGPYAPRRRPRAAPRVIAFVGACLALGAIAIVVVVRAARPRAPDTASAITASAMTASAMTASASAPTGAATSGPAPSPIPPPASSTSSSAGASPSAKGGSALVPKGFGRLTVETYTPAPPDSAVFIGDKSYGEVGTSLVVPCGYRWLFVGRADAKGRLVRKLSKPYSVFTPCGASAADGHVKLTLR